MVGPTRSPVLGGHGTCKESGCVCGEGWTGSICDMPLCESDCNHSALVCKCNIQRALGGSARDKASLSQSWGLTADLFRRATCAGGALAFEQTQGRPDCFSPQMHTGSFLHTSAHPSRVRRLFSSFGSGSKRHSGGTKFLKTRRAFSPPQPVLYVRSHRNS